MPSVPKAKLSPERLSPEPSNDQNDSKNKSQSLANLKEGKDVEPFIEPPEVFDNVGKDYGLFTYLILDGLF